MASNNSIIKRTEYWLPPELWGHVKEYMGMAEEGKVRWDLIKTATLKHLIKSGLPTYDITFPKRKVKLNHKQKAPYTTTTLIQSADKTEWLEPKEAYLRRVKYLLMKKRKMTPIKWRTLSLIVYKDIPPFIRVRKGTTFKSIDPASEIEYNCEVIAINKNWISIIQTPPEWIEIQEDTWEFKKAIFNRDFKDIIITKW